MTTRRTTIGRSAIPFVLGCALALVATHAVGTATLQAQQPTPAQESPIKRTLLVDTPMTGIEGKKLVMAIAELAPGAVAGKHYHHGDELLYMLDGTARMEVEGRGVVVLERGDSYHIPAGTHHDVTNIGTTTGRALVVFAIDADKPVAVPVK